MPDNPRQNFMSEPTASSDTALPVADTWDAGDLACGELVLELRTRMSRLAPGEILCLITRDLGAILDIPAWCRLTGHALRRAAHPEYYLERRQ